MSFRLDAERLARSRFSISRLSQVMISLLVLREPQRAPYARSWVRTTRRRIDPARMSLLLELVPDPRGRQGRWYAPDFLAPVPTTYAPSSAEELAAVRATDPTLVREQLAMAYQVGTVPEVVRRATGILVADPRAPVPRGLRDALEEGGEAMVAAMAAEQLSYYWELALADSWSDIERVLEQDIRHHAARMSREGPEALFSDLHPAVGWTGSDVQLRLAYEVSEDASAGIVLVPSVFLHSRPQVWIGDPGEVMIGYPAVGRGAAWSDPSALATESGSSQLLGRSVHALLADLDVARTTSELAERHALSPPTVSHHIARLHRAGAVERRRDGRFVYYVRTDRGSALVDALTAPTTEQ